MTWRKKYLYAEFFWSVFFRIRTEYGDSLRKFPYSVLMWEHTDQKISQYGHFSGSVSWHKLGKANRVIT